MPTKKEFLDIPGVKDRLEQIASENGFSVEELLTVIENESNFDTAAKNTKSSATGLIQFMESTADDLGIDHSTLAGMNELDQLDVVAKYFKRNHKKGTHPYITVALPVAGRFEPNEAITAEGLVAKGVYETKEEAAEKLEGWKKVNHVWVDQENDTLSYNSILAYGGVTNKDKESNKVKQQQMLDAGISVSVDGIWGPQSRSGWVKFNEREVETEPKVSTEGQIAIDIKPTPFPPSTNSEAIEIPTKEEFEIAKEAENTVEEKEVEKKENEIEENGVTNEVVVEGEGKDLVETIESTELSEEQKKLRDDKNAERERLKIEEEQRLEKEFEEEKERLRKAAEEKKKVKVKPKEVETTETEAVVEEEKVEEVQTKEIEVLDASGNPKMITVPVVNEETVAKEKKAIAKEEEEESNEEIIKPKYSDFETSSDYMKARMEYHKSIEAKPEEVVVEEEEAVVEEEVVEEEVTNEVKVKPTVFGGKLPAHPDFATRTLLNQSSTGGGTDIPEFPVLEEKIEGMYNPDHTGTNNYIGQDRDAMSVLLNNAISKNDLVLQKELIEAGALGTTELAKIKVDEKREEEKKARRHTGGDNYYDNVDYVEKKNKIKNSNTAETLIKRHGTDVDLSSVTNEDAWMAIAVKSEGEGGLGLSGGDAKKEWDETRAQFGTGYERGEVDGTTGLKIGDEQSEIDLGDAVYNEVINAAATYGGGATDAQTFDVSWMTEDQQKIFKRQLLNAVPREEWVNWANTPDIYDGQNITNLRESYVLQAKHGLFNAEMETQSKESDALSARGKTFEFEKQQLVDNVGTWESKASDIKSQIKNIKLKYGSYRDAEYTQTNNMSLADKHRLRGLIEEGGELDYQRLGLQVNQKDLVSKRDQFNTDITNFQNKAEETYLNYSFNAVDGVFDPSFNSTRNLMEWNESIKNKSKAGDVAATFLEEMVRLKVLTKAINPTTLKATAYAATAGVVADLTSPLWAKQVYQFSPNSISEYNDEGMHHTGMIFDILAKGAALDFMPTSADSSGSITNHDFKKDEGDGWWGNLYEKMAPGWAGGQGNWNAYSTSKTFAQLLPYSLNIMSAYKGTAAQSEKVRAALLTRTNKVIYGEGGEIGKKIVNSLNKNWVTSPKMMGSLNMIRVNHKMTFFDNYADGRARGLNAGDAFTYGNFLSLATGISQTIMPDFNWINTSGGKAIVERLIGDLMKGSFKAVGKTLDQVGKKQINREALKIAGKNFLKEHLEEQTDVLMQDIVKSVYLADHSLDILNVNMQAEVLSGTSVLTLPLGSVSAIRTRNNARNQVYKMFHESGRDIINHGRAELKAINEKIATTDNTSKGKALREVLTKEKLILEANIKEGENIYEAMKASPKNVTDTQIELLVKKKKLNERKKELSSADKSFNSKEIEEINNEIISIDEQVQKHGVGNYQATLYNTLLKNAMKLAPKLGIGFVEDGLNEEEYQQAVELEIKGRQTNNAEVQGKINKLNETNPKSKKDKKAKLKKIKELEGQKQSLTRLDFDAPGMIVYDHSGEGNHKIYIRPGAAKWSGNNAVVLHEMLHVMLYRTMKKNPKMLKGLSYLLKKELEENPEKYGGSTGYVTSSDNESGKFDQYKFEKDEDGNSSVQFDEMFTVFIEALAQGNISVQSNIVTEIEDVVRRLFSKVGVNFNIKGHEGMVNFLKDFHKEMMEGEGGLSKGMMKNFKDGLKLQIDPKAKTAADKYENLMMEKYGVDVWEPAESKYSNSIVARNSSQNVYKNKMIKDDLQLSDDTKKIVEENSRIRKLILEEGIVSGKKIVASEGLQDLLVENNLAMAVSLGSFAARNPNIMNLEPGKRVSADQFISGYYMQLSNLARTYDASVNEFGQYLNTILPLRYGEILAAEKKGAVDGSVGLDFVKDIEDDIDDDYTPDDVSTSPSVDTADRLGIKNETKPFIDNKVQEAQELLSLRNELAENYSEETAEKIAELESKGAAELDIESMSVKKAPNLLYKITSKLFGIDEDKLNPKSEKWLANLRKDNKRGSNEVRAAQRAVVQHVQLILSTIFNEGHTNAHKSAGMPNSLLKFGYNKSTKRIGNSFPQYKKPNLSEIDLLEFVGVKKVKGGYEFTIDRNTGTKLLAIASMVDRNMSLQGINESLNESGDITARIKNSLEDGLSKSSRSIYYIKNPELRPIIDEKLHIISDRLDNIDFYDTDVVKKIIIEAFKGTEVNGAKFAKSLMGKTGAITRYVQSPTLRTYMSFDEFATQEVQREVLKKGIFSMLGIVVDKKADLYTKKRIKLARSRIADFASGIVRDYQDGEITKKKAMQLLYMLEQQHITAAKIGNGKYEAIEGTNTLVESKKTGAQRDQFFNNARDFRLFMNTTLAGSGLEFGLTTTENNKIKKSFEKKDENGEITDNGILSLTPQKSKSVIEALIKKVFSFQARKDEAMMARELVKMQIKFYAGHKMMTNEELAMHIFTFGSNMSTASRRAANVYGIQEGILSEGTDGEYVYGKLDNAGTDLEYEHGKPHGQLMLELLDSALDNKGNLEAMDKAMDESFVDYEVNIITKVMDKTLTATNRKSSMGAKYVKGLLQGWKQRLYNEENLGHPDMGAIISLDGKKTIVGSGHSKAAKVLVKSKADIEIDRKISEGISKANSINYSKNPKGITVLDFDDTLATSKSLIKFTKPDGTKGTLNAEQYASSYEELTESGYEWDFSEFNKVVDGKVAPLFNKAMKLQGKFGPENMFVLTARPAEAAPAIFAFLQAHGLKIPLKNITGLANSTANAKALWVAEKVGEGYNDFYFADDALQNVQAVDNILEQFDVKRKVQQARAKSLNYDKQFNEILEESTGVGADKKFSKSKAIKRGEDKGKHKFFIPPSAEDFIGLIYSFLGKGKKGEADLSFFKKTLIEPLNKAYRGLDSAKQAISNDYKQLGKTFPDVRKKLFKKINKDFTYNDAIRVYLWAKFGFKIWGLSEKDKNELVALVEGDADLKGFADALSVISKSKDGYIEPNENWAIEDIRTDLMHMVSGVGRKAFFSEFLENVKIIFSEENLNKIQAIYGDNFVEALRDMLYRIETGTNRSFGSNRLVNRFMNWINGAIATTMFFNARSAVLQTLSIVNFINWTDNNMMAVAKTLANPKQFWTDFSMIFNSDMLKQRREGRSFDVNANEMASEVSNSKAPIKSALTYLLKLGFLPTQIADSFAIATGGASFYRNRLNTYLTEGMNQTEAEKKAFADFQVIAEATQQSARQDMVSQQQASVLGRVVLAFQNTPMQYARLMKKAILDLSAGRGDPKENVSKIIYYGAIQNVIFYGMQTALFALMFGDDDDDEVLDKKTERIINGSIDSILRGMGVGGAVVSTVKNMIKEFANQQGKSRNQKDESAVLMELLNISPPIGIKARQIKTAQTNINWNQKTISQMPYYNLDNPAWESAFLTTQAMTNIPLARLHTKVTNLRGSLNRENEGWQRLAMFMGWTKWNLGVKSKAKPKSNSRSRVRTRTRPRSRIRLR